MTVTLWFCAGTIAIYLVTVIAVWRLYLRGRRYVYGENAPIPTKTFGQRRSSAPDGASIRVLCKHTFWLLRGGNALVCKRCGKREEIIPGGEPA